MPTNRGGPTPCESQAERPTGSGSPRARTTHSMMAPSVFEQVPVVLSTRIVRNPKSTRRPPRGSLDSRSTAWPWWPSEWAWSLLLSARCPAQPCHPQLPAGRSLGTAGAIVEVSHDRKQLRSSPGVSPLSRWLAESVAGWRTAGLAGASGRGGEQVPLHPFPHFPRGGQLGEAVGELADSPDRKVADRVEHRFVTGPRHAEAPQPQRQQ